MVKLQPNHKIDIESAYARFTVPVPSSTSWSEIADEALVFELGIDDDSEADQSHLSINGRLLELNITSLAHQTESGTLDVVDTTGDHRSLAFFVSLDPPDESSVRLLQFQAGPSSPSDHDSVAFAARLDDASARSLSLLSLIIRPNLRGPGISFDLVNGTLTTVSGTIDLDTMAPKNEKHVSFDLVDELESLHVLEAEAEDLKAVIATKKQTIAKHLREHRDRTSLRQLLEECDGLLCSARVLAQKICDKVDNMADRTKGYVVVQDSQIQAGLQDAQSFIPQKARNCTKSKSIAQSSGSAESASLPFMVTKNGTSAQYHFEDLTDASNPLARAMAIIATLLGLVALCRFVRRRCMSMRTRVERAADREERRNARAYRKAARRADMRKRWDALVGCFRPAEPPRMEDYDEKRALILQDAFLEHIEDLDQAEKGQIMEAEIRELRHAHEIVASLVRVDRERYDMTPRNDPPPPLVPLPYTPDSRSRASTHTLPSYTAESLPDYSSRPPTLAESNMSDSLVDGFPGYTPTASNNSGEGRTAPPSITSSGRTRVTQISSVPDISPRMSEETLQMRQSRDA
ncbi:hypothetical protein LTR78_010246 [Recurvomyces mirabilis]|uniref:Uncharacterized protein n=1 Tax=Recurvomyces mirabilis TaxID=574656 RepID=A0AAE0WI36_9PEZI|nr:hypothetical protein LTR78_010246 [Recurvomyces mirabilis]KAK5156409.1 hypothetical protein LTS14_005297 [Recurvomyces mirabilis]